MISKDYVITSQNGIHARPATVLIRLAKTFQSVILIKKENKEVRLNSMVNILTLGAKGGDTVTISVAGPDEQEAAEAVNLFFMEQLNEH